MLFRSSLMDLAVENKKFIHLSTIQIEQCGSVFYPSRINPIRATSTRHRYPDPCRIRDNPRVTYCIARHRQHIRRRQLSLEQCCNLKPIWHHHKVALVQYAIAEVEQEQPAAGAVSQASPGANMAPLQARTLAETGQFCAPWSMVNPIEDRYEIL